MSQVLPQFPTVDQLRSKMSTAQENLYSELKKCISEKMNILQLNGCITSSDITSLDNNVEWRLPYESLHEVKHKLVQDLVDLGYDPELGFDNVESVEWIWCFKIYLPEE